MARDLSKSSNNIIDKGASYLNTIVLDFVWLNSLASSRARFLDEMIKNESSAFGLARTKTAIDR